jgi:hypothetical protein
MIINAKDVHHNVPLVNQTSKAYHNVSHVPMAHFLVPLSAAPNALQLAHPATATVSTANSAEQAPLKAAIDLTVKPNSVSN